MSSASRTAPTELTPLKALGFSMPSLPVGAVAVAVPVFLPNYYASHLGLNLEVVGGAFFAVRLIDVLFDPVIGVLIDRTHSRWGRYRLWMVGGVPLFVLAIYQLFLPSPGVGAAYLIGWLLGFYTGQSIVLLPHLSWAAAIAPDYHARSRLFGWIQIVGVGGALGVLLAPNVQIMGWLVMGSVVCGVALALLTTPEPRAVRDPHQAIRVRDYWEMIVRPDMRRVLAADFCLQLGPNWMAALYLFYFRDLRGFSVGQAHILLFIYVAAGLVGAVALSRVATVFGKHRTLMGSAAGFSIGLICLTQLPRANILAAAPFMFVMGFLATSFVLLDRAMIADVGDAVLLETGRQRTGLLYAILSSSQKVAGALSIFLTFKALSLLGYNAKEGATNTVAAMHGLSLVFLLGPVVFVMLGGACFIGYGLDAKRHLAIRTALDARGAAAS
jgi:Na+/melibiose symporter-like transporter